jgi:hypothetical protein
VVPCVEDFSMNLSFKHLSPTASHIEVILDDVRIPADNPKQVVLHVAFCGKGSKFFNALMKWKTLADDDAANQRAADAFARLGVVGWANVEDGGKPVPFSHTGTKEIFDALIAAKRYDKIDRALTPAMNPDNYTEALPAAEVAELGKP